MSTYEYMIEWRQTGEWLGGDPGQWYPSYDYDDIPQTYRSLADATAVMEGEESHPPGRIEFRIVRRVFTPWEPLS